MLDISASSTLIHQQNIIRCWRETSLWLSFFLEPQEKSRGFYNFFPLPAHLWEVSGMKVDGLVFFSSSSAPLKSPQHTRMHTQTSRYPPDGHQPSAERGWCQPMLGCITAERRLILLTRDGEDTPCRPQHPELFITITTTNYVK